MTMKFAGFPDRKYLRLLTKYFIVFSLRKQINSSAEKQFFPLLTENSKVKNIEMTSLVKDCLPQSPIPKTIQVLDIRDI